MNAVARKSYLRDSVRAGSDAVSHVQSVGGAGELQFRLQIVH